MKNALKSQVKRLVQSMTAVPPPAPANRPAKIVDVEADHIVLGNSHAEWPVCPWLMGQSKRAAIIYSVGVGADVSWDSEMLSRFNCLVWGFDPTPKTIGWANQADLPFGFTFVPLGLAEQNGVLKFAPPEDSNHISFALTEAEADNVVSCEVRTLPTLMKQLGHTYVDILKMDIEGAEFGVLWDMLSTDIRPDQLLIEFHHDMYGYTPSDTHRLVLALYDAGYRRFYKSRSGREHGYYFEPAAERVRARAAEEARRAEQKALREVEPQSAPVFSTLPVAPPAPSTTTPELDRGVIYFAFGKPSLDEAKLSFSSLKESNPELPAAIFTDLPDLATEFDIVHQFTRTELYDIERYFVETQRMPSLKVRFLERSPFRKTIHLDCDTYVKGSLDEFFNELENQHFILTNMPEIDQTVVEGGARPVHATLKNLTKSSAFSCAVFGYRRAPETDELLRVWWTQFVEKTSGDKRLKGNWGHTGGTNEQAILHEMLADGSFVRANIQKTTLPNTKYNAGMSMWPRLKSESLWDDCVVLHSHKIIQKIGQVGVDGLPDLEELQKFA